MLKNVKTNISIVGSKYSCIKGFVKIGIIKKYSKINLSFKFFCVKSIMIKKEAINEI